jgi:nucleoid DNA-binding protein
MDAFVEIASLSLACGEVVNIRGFGKFDPRKTEGRMRKDPRTGADIYVPDRVRIGFATSKTLKARLNPTSD